MTTPSRKTAWTFIQVIYVLSSVLQLPVARGTLTPHGLVPADFGNQLTFTCNVTGAAAVWNITRFVVDTSRLDAIKTTTRSTGLSVASNNARITTTDTSGVTPSSTITISEIIAEDTGVRIWCVNQEDNSDQGMATISIDGMIPNDTVQVYCGGSQTFTCSGHYTKELGWNITGLRGIDIPEPFNARREGPGKRHPRINSSDTGDTKQFGASTIIISKFSATDNGGTIQCINVDDNIVQGMATISIVSPLVSIDQAAVIVPVLEGGTAVFTCKLKTEVPVSPISWSLTSADGVHTDINPNRTNVIGSSRSFLHRDMTQLQIDGVQNSLNGTRVECSPANANATPSSICTESVYISVHNFTTVSPALIRTINLTSRLGVVIVWFVPDFVVGYIDGSVISVVMVTPSGPKPIRQTTVGERVIAFAVDLPEKGARYHVTVRMTMNGLYSKPLDVELDV